MAMVGTSGTVTERFHYDPYGKSIVLDANFALDSNGVSDVDWEYRYTSREFDPETELYYFRARYLHSGLGRFCSRDPIGYEGSRWNLAEYVGSRPNSSVDPSGLQLRGAPITPRTLPSCPQAGTGASPGSRTPVTPFYRPIPGWKELPDPYAPPPSRHWPIGFPTGPTISPGPSDPGYPDLIERYRNREDWKERYRREMESQMRRGIIQQRERERRVPERLDDDEAWGEVCCVYMHHLDDRVQRIQTVCHYPIRSPISECCDEDSLPGYDLIDSYAGRCGPDGY
jgi:RHS repeat-associated protein